MKSLLIVFVAVLALSACKKDYNCVCTDATKTRVIHDTEKKAKEACTGAVGGFGITINTNDCVIK